MDMSSMNMASMATSSMPMATSSSSMHSMDMSTMTMSASQMHMTFFTSSSTPLFSSSWTPNSTSTYAGTCIFLVILSFILRILYAFKATLERKWLHESLQRRYVRVADAGGAEAGRPSDGKGGLTGVLSANGVEEKVRLVQPVDVLAGGLWSRPWRLSVDLPRALLVTVMVGVGYLLMLAVMTMNVGYFLSVLAGAFVGELLFGRYSTHVEDHH